jgi:hypothetical protein
MTGGIVFFSGTRGGVGKTVMSHAACLGAVLHDQPAVYVLTDPMRKLREEGRPYGVLDGRDPERLAHILSESRANPSGWTIIDGGGNRPAFDEAVSAVADLCIFPFRASDEDLDVVGNDLRRIPKGTAWPTGWPTNPYARIAANLMMYDFVKTFPRRVIEQPISFVNASTQLLGESLGSPPTVVRDMARKIFAIMAEEFENRVRKPADTPAIVNVA